uniref:Uncharacterized protein n=1 Tax=Erinnyis ello granulovirus TaxID=307444 RepID=A0A288WIT6_9BBAC|nr:hypothetical protein EREL_110 [Erinnyis ello granulovirus]
MKMLDIEKVIQKRIKNKHMVNVVRHMTNAHKYVRKNTIIQKFLHEYYNCNNLTNGDTLTTILQAFEISSDENTTDAFLTDSFYRACKLTNIVLMAGCQKRRLITTKQNVRIKCYLVNDSQICEECYKSFGGSKSLPDIQSECSIDPEHSYFFCCSYICEYCYSNKLYTKMYICRFYFYYTKHSQVFRTHYALLRE